MQHAKAVCVVLVALVIFSTARLCLEAGFEVLKLNAAKFATEIIKQEKELRGRITEEDL